MVGATAAGSRPTGASPKLLATPPTRGSRQARPSPAHAADRQKPRSAATTLDAGPPVVEDLAVDQLVVSRKGPRLKGPDDASHSPP